MNSTEFGWFHFLPQTFFFIFSYFSVFLSKIFLRKLYLKKNRMTNQNMVIASFSTLKTGIKWIEIHKFNRVWLISIFSINLCFHFFSFIQRCVSENSLWKISNVKSYHSKCCFFNTEISWQRGLAIINSTMFSLFKKIAKNSYFYLFTEIFI